MENYSVQIPNYSIGGDDVYMQIARFCVPYGKKVAVLGGETALSKAHDALATALATTPLEVTGWIVYGKECSFERAEALLQLPSVQEADMFFAVGGGKAIDTVKVMAAKAGKPFFTFPTIAATCAAVTSIAAVYTEDHRFADVYDRNHPALHCFINERIIGEAPSQYLWAGIGDSIAKYYESRLSVRGRELFHGNQIGVMISGMCADPLMHFAVQGYRDAKNGKVTQDLRETILNVIISTGFASVFLDSEYNTAVAHSLTYGLVELPQVEGKHMHGEIVSFGVLVLLMMDDQPEEFAKVYEFNRAMGLPRCLADLDVKVSELAPVLAKALQTFDLDVMPYRVTEEMYRDALNKTEAYYAAHQ